MKNSILTKSLVLLSFLTLIVCFILFKGGYLFNRNIDIDQTIENKHFPRNNLDTISDIISSKKDTTPAIKSIVHKIERTQRKIITPKEHVPPSYSEEEFRIMSSSKSIILTEPFKAKQFSDTIKRIKNHSIH
jgi:peptidoglycan hydrolase CwlO-like protein